MQIPPVAEVIVGSNKLVVVHVMVLVGGGTTQVVFPAAYLPCLLVICLMLFLGGGTTQA